ncbi:MAG TPA: FoF1 ATP synthase subunit gamma [Rickettsiales bacterium]|nr:FoF1 ATP synthase subunit gamma [Rickettsiales bacterium]
METLDSLKKTLNTSKSIKQVVSTMKALSAANIKKYDKIVKTLYAYRTNVELGIQAMMMYGEDLKISEIKYVKKTGDKNLLIVFGSNQGLCGRFNDKMKNFIVEDVNNDDSQVIVIGERLLNLMGATKLNIVKSVYLPNSIENASSMIYELLQIIENKLKNNEIDNVFLYYTSSDDTTNGTPTKTRLIPIDRKLLENAKNKVWPTNKIPYWQINNNVLISDLLKQYIFVILNNALANSITSEQKNRLITLQSAETNINELIRNKTLEYNQKRQSTITAELLDVVTGYQVSKKRKKS